MEDCRVVRYAMRSWVEAQANVNNGWTKRFVLLMGGEALRYEVVAAWHKRALYQVLGLARLVLVIGT